MVKKSYDWVGGAHKDEHTKKKHIILREYFRQYLITRCKFPRQSKFRLVIVDGFAGAGLYQDHSFGSPLIFIETLKSALEEINIGRTAQGTGVMHIECLMIFNDLDKNAIEQLEHNTAPYLGEIKSEVPDTLQINVEFLNGKFDDLYPSIKQRINETGCGNVLFNLDQCGYSLVPTSILRNIMQSWDSAEIIFTFMVKSLLAYISPDQAKSGTPLEPEMQERVDALLASPDSEMNKPEWLGNVERIVYDCLHSCAPYVSPFSINNPDGWRYWLMHFANKPRAREVYNNILHDNSSTQAHFGRAGLNMLAYNPDEDGKLLLFDIDARSASIEQLHDDIPRHISASGDAMSMEDFLKSAYSATSAHSDDMRTVIVDSEDIEAITESGNPRRSAGAIRITDTLRLKTQKSMFSMWPTIRKS